MTRKATNVPAKPSNRAQIERDDCGPNPKPKPPIPICLPNLCETDQTHCSLSADQIPKSLAASNRRLPCSSRSGVTSHPYSRCRRQRAFELHGYRTGTAQTDPAKPRKNPQPGSGPRRGSENRPRIRDRIRQLNRPGSRHGSPGNNTPESGSDCQRKRQGPRLRSAGPLSPSMMGQRLRKKFIPAWRGRSRTWSCLSVGIPPDGHVSECQQRRGEEDTHSISQLCSTYYANTKESNNRAQHHDQTKSAKDRLREERVSP